MDLHLLAMTKDQLIVTAGTAVKSETLLDCIVNNGIFH